MALPSSRDYDAVDTGPLPHGTVNALQDGVVDHEARVTVAELNQSSDLFAERIMNVPASALVGDTPPAYSPLGGHAVVIPATDVAFWPIVLPGLYRITEITVRGRRVSGSTALVVELYRSNGSGGESLIATASEAGTSYADLVMAGPFAVPTGQEVYWVLVTGTGSPIVEVATMQIKYDSV